MEKGRFKLEYTFVIIIFAVLIIFVIVARPPTGKVIQTLEELNETNETLLINISSPVKDQLYDKNSVLLSASLNQEPNSIIIYLDNLSFQYSNETDIQVNTKDLFNNIDLEDGSHEIKISAMLNDVETSESVSFSIDTQEPVIHSQLPDQVWPSLITFSVNYTELNLDTITLFRKLNGLLNKTELSDCESGESKTCSLELNLNETEIGDNFKYYFIINDSLGRETEGEEVDLTISECAPNWVEEEWGACQEGDIQYREWVDANNCGNDTEKRETENQTCDYCTPDWQCSDWSSCSGEEQTRSCSDANSCGEEEGRPSETQSCTEEENDEEESETTTGSETVPMKKAAPVSPSGKSYILTPEKLKSGSREKLVVNDKLKFNINEGEHQIILKSMTGDEISIEISSEPQTATIKTGETKDFDVTGDGISDISVKYLGLLVDKAFISVTQLSVEPEAPVEKPAEEATQEENKTGGQIVGATVGGGGTWKWVILVILVLGIVYGIFYFIRKTRKKVEKKLSKIIKPEKITKLRRVSKVK